MTSKTFPRSLQPPTEPLESPQLPEPPKLSLKPPTVTPELPIKKQYNPLSDH